MSVGDGPGEAMVQRQNRKAVHYKIMYDQDPGTPLLMPNSDYLRLHGDGLCPTTSTFLRHLQFFAVIRRCVLADDAVEQVLAAISDIRTYRSEASN